MLGLDLYHLTVDDRKAEACYPIHDLWNIYKRVESFFSEKLFSKLFETTGVRSIKVFSVNDKYCNNAGVSLTQIGKD